MVQRSSYKRGNVGSIPIRPNGLNSSGHDGRFRAKLPCPGGSNSIPARTLMRIVHLTASTFFGGPERQMLGLARALPANCQTSFLSFWEGGRCQEFVKHVRWNGFPGAALKHDTPNLPAAAWELASHLNDTRANIVLCHGYKANLIGRFAAHAVGIPVVAVSRGWTGESRKVQLYE